MWSVKKNLWFSVEDVENLRPENQLNNVTVVVVGLIEMSDVLGFNII